MPLAIFNAMLEPVSAKKTCKRKDVAAMEMRALLHTLLPVTMDSVSLLVKEEKDKPLGIRVYAPIPDVIARIVGKAEGLVHPLQGVLSIDSVNQSCFNHNTV